MNNLEIIVSVIIVVFGAFLANHFALKRDKRKDFNKAADPISEELEIQLLQIESGRFPASANKTTRETFIPIIKNSSYLRQKLLKFSITNYLNSKSECGEFVDGIYRFNNPEKLKKSIKLLQLLIPHK